jgi:hypothetical protein
MSLPVEWKPISTAPKDGTEIYVNNGDWESYLVHWCKRTKRWWTVFGPLHYAPSEWYPAD